MWTLLDEYLYPFSCAIHDEEADIEFVWATNARLSDAARLGDGAVVVVGGDDRLVDVGLDTCTAKIHAADAWF